MIKLAICFLMMSTIVGAKDCSGNGLRFPDTGLCNCWQCWQGDECETAVSPCVISDGGGNPLVYQDYWATHDPSHWDITVRADYRTGYQTDVITGPHIPAQSVGVSLVEEIKRIHEMTGNAITKDKYIVIGSGCTNLIAAVSYAAYSTAQRPLSMFARPPYYQGYPGWANIYSAQTPFSSSTTLNPANVLEFVSYPNNPDGYPRDPVYPDSPFVVHDMVYYWPSLVEITAPLDEPIMLFSMSKLSGHAGTRLGWALVSNETIANAMAEFIFAAEIAPSIEAQWRSLNILRRIRETEGDFFVTMRAVMLSRWAEVLPLFQGQTNYALLSNPGTFYLWIQCLDTTQSEPCYQRFAAANIQGLPGNEFGSTTEFVRLEMVLDGNTWPYFIKALTSVLQQ